MDLLELELAHLRAKDIVIQAETTLSEIRNDGWLRSNARVSGPAVILTFDSRKSIYSYPCDTFTHWHANLRAIALALEALRKVDRFGVTSNNEQYQGFKRLAAAEPKDIRRRAIDDLFDLAMMSVNGNDDSVETIERAYRFAAKRCHPDAGGVPEEWTKLQAAMSVLRPKKDGK